MRSKKHRPEQIIKKLREAEMMLAAGVLVQRLLRIDGLKQIFGWFHVIVFSETHFEKVGRARLHPKPSRKYHFPRPGTNTFGLPDST